MKYAKFEDVEKAIVFSELIKDKTCGEVKNLLNSIPTIEGSIVERETKREFIEECYDGCEWPKGSPQCEGCDRL